MPVPFLSGKSSEDLAEAMLDAFPTRSPFEQMLWYDLEIKLARMVGDVVGMDDVVFRVITDADDQGWLPDLVAAALKRVPRATLLSRWAERHPHVVDRKAEQRALEGALLAEGTGRDYAGRGRSGRVPVGRKRTIHDRIESNLGADLVRTLLLLNDPGNGQVLAARSVDALAAAGSTGATARVVRRELWEVTDLLLEYVEDQVLQLIPLMSTQVVDIVDEITFAVATTLRLAGPAITAEMRTEPDLLLRLLTEQSDRRRQAWDHGPTSLPPFQPLIGAIVSYLAEAALAEPGLTLAGLHDLAASGGAAATIRMAISRMPQERDQDSGRPNDSYAVQYLRMVTRTLDTLEVLGIDLLTEVRRYSLTTAYVTLEATVPRPTAQGTVGYDAQPVDAALQTAGRLVLIEGEAGSGKTTVLQWAAVSMARGELPGGDLHPWHGRIPLFVRLRRYVKRALPTIEELTREVAGASLHSRQPAGWVAKVLEEGRAVLLIDGLDEVRTDERATVQAWLEDLTWHAVTEQHNTLVVTSRPAAARGGTYDLDRFTPLTLTTMSFREIFRFIQDWHAATLERLPPDQHESHRARAAHLVVEIDRSPALRDLARTPLLCAVICALNYKSPGGLPKQRITLYEDALKMMLGRREHEKGVEPTGVGAEERTAVLQSLAQWFVVSGLSEAPRDDVRSQLGLVAGMLRGVDWTGGQILHDLLERSGVLREPAPGTIDFVHRTFQEFLAARHLVSGGSTRIMLDHVRDADWQGVISMAVGWASKTSAVEWRRLTDGIVDAIVADDSVSSGRSPLREFLAECFEMSVVVERESYERATAYLEQRIPPLSRDEVKSVVAMGQTALPLLRRVLQHTVQDPATASLCVRAIVGIGSERAIEALVPAAQRFGHELAQELVDAWSGFTPGKYGMMVLQAIPSFMTTAVVVRDQTVLPFIPYELNLDLHFVPDVITADFAGHVAQARVTSLTIPAWPADMTLDWLPTVLASEVELHELQRFDLGDSHANDTILDLTLGFADHLPLAEVDCTTFIGFLELTTLTIRGPVILRNIHALTAFRIRELTLAGGVRVDWRTERLTRSWLTDLTIEDFHDDDLLALSNCVNLQSLTLRRSSVVDLSGIEGMEQLQFLDVSGSTRLVDIGAVAHLPALTDIGLGGCDQLQVSEELLAATDLDLGEVFLAAHEHPDDVRPVGDLDGALPLPPHDFEDEDFRDLLTTFPDSGEATDSGRYLDGWMIGTLWELNQPADHGVVSYDELLDLGDTDQELADLQRWYDDEWGADEDWDDDEDWDGPGPDDSLPEAVVPALVLGLPAEPPDADDDVDEDAEIPPLNEVAPTLAAIRRHSYL
ncbi:NACHT domain-containing protein [Dactylosporangium sp. NPDC050588]|uniref:NACHT domain-containing protein n=1 Tax=Dactylosporangium sp. NPDC050588 TaxID=3157211 RepID=UPI0033E5CB47